MTVIQNEQQQDEEQDQQRYDAMIDGSTGHPPRMTALDRILSLLRLSHQHHSYRPDGRSQALVLYTPPPTILTYQDNQGQFSERNLAYLQAKLTFKRQKISQNQDPTLDMSNTSLDRHSPGLGCSVKSGAEGICALSLQGENLRCWPVELLLLGHKINWLDLSKNSIREMEENSLSSFDRLFGLSLAFNNLSPASISFILIPAICRTITWLDFTGNKSLCILPSLSLSQCGKLAGLGLSECGIFQLPPDEFLWNALSLKLSKLGLYGNCLRTLPSFFTRLVNLTKLDLSSNMLESLPEDIGSLVSLKWLNLTDNRLVLLPPSFSSLTKLESLGLGSNLLAALPDLSSLCHLSILPIYENYLESVPTWVGRLERLRKLDLSYNFIVNVPEDMFYLPNIYYLNLRGNRITNLDSLIFRGDPQSTRPLLPLCTTLNLAENLLDSIPYCLVTDLASVKSLKLDLNDTGKCEARSTDCNVCIGSLSGRLLLQVLRNKSTGKNKLTSILCMKINQMTTNIGKCDGCSNLVLISDEMSSCTGLVRRLKQTHKSFVTMIDTIEGQTAHTATLPIKMCFCSAECALRNDAYHIDYLRGSHPP